MAFSLTTTNRGYQGQDFVDNAKAKEIIGRYTLYWSEFAEDIRYATFLNYLIAFETDPHDTEAIRVALNEGSRFACNLVRDLAKKGRLTPNQVVSVLDHFIQPDTAGSIIPLKILNVFDSSLKLEDLKERMQLMINEYKIAYQMHHPDYVAENDVVQIENFDRIEEEIFPSGTMGNPEKYSPRQRYLNARDQELDAIDQQEYARFSPRLIQRCRSMEDHYLGQLTPEKFRKALLLYNMLRVVQLDTLTAESANQKQIVENKFTVHESVYDIAALKSMIAQLPALQSDSTEDEIGDALLSQLVDWIVHPPEGIEAWVDYVAKNGSRGMGSEIAHVREASGAVHLHFAEMKDRDESLPGLHPINDREDIESVFAHDSNRFKRALTDMHRERNAVIIEQTVLIDFEQQLYTELEQIGSLILPTDSANESALELAKQNQRSVFLMLDVVAGLFKDQSPEALEGAEHEVNRIIGTFTGNESNEFNTVTNAMRDMIRSHIEHKAKLG